MTDKEQEIEDYMGHMIFTLSESMRNLIRD